MDNVYFDESTWQVTELGKTIQMLVGDINKTVYKQTDPLTFEQLKEAENLAKYYVRNIWQAVKADMEANDANS